MSNGEIGKAEIFKLTGELLKAHVANNSVAAGDLAGLIGSVHQALTDAATGQPVERPETEPAADVTGLPAFDSMPGLPALPPGATIQTEPEPPQEPAVPIAESVTDDTLICLECGRSMTMLTRHLQLTHQITPEQYRRKWKLPRKYPMQTKTWTERAAARAVAPGGAVERMQARRAEKAAAAAAAEPPAEPVAKVGKTRIALVGPPELLTPAKAAGENK